MPRNTSGLRRGGPGRPKGVPNKANREIKDLARKLLEDDEYQRSLAERLKDGRAQTVEALLYHYAYGKPKETVEHGGVDGQPIEHRVVFGGRYKP